MSCSATHAAAGWYLRTKLWLEISANDWKFGFTFCGTARQKYNAGSFALLESVPWAGGSIDFIAKVSAVQSRAL
jgi:hypothetical protein